MVEGGMNWGGERKKKTFGVLYFCVVRLPAETCSERERETPANREFHLKAFGEREI